jgi:hypothetical protein
VWDLRVGELGASEYEAGGGRVEVRRGRERRPRGGYAGAGDIDVRAGRIDEYAGAGGGENKSDSASVEWAAGTGILVVDIALVVAARGKLIAEDASARSPCCGIAAGDRPQPGAEHERAPDSHSVAPFHSRGCRSQSIPHDLLGQNPAA